MQTKEIFMTEVNEDKNLGDTVEDRKTEEGLSSAWRVQEWRVVPMKIHGWAVHDAEGNVVVHDIYDGEIARFIVRAANDYYVDKAALRGVAIMLNTELAKYENEPWAQRVRAALL